MWKNFLLFLRSVRNKKTRCWQKVRCLIVKPGDAHSFKLRHTCVQHRVVVLRLWNTWKPHNEIRFFQLSRRLILNFVTGHPRIILYVDEKYKQQIVNNSIDLQWRTSCDMKLFFFDINFGVKLEDNGTGDLDM